MYILHNETPLSQSKICHSIIDMTTRPKDRQTPRPSHARITEINPSDPDPDPGPPNDEGNGDDNNGNNSNPGSVHSYPSTQIRIWTWTWRYGQSTFQSHDPYRGICHSWQARITKDLRQGTWPVRRFWSTETPRIPASTEIELPSQEKVIPIRLWQSYLCSVIPERNSSRLLQALPDR